ncbi:N-acetylmuramoyl-L-alanine amidase [Streptomyces sp. PA03-6a]|nr:N-acetylmuramoyl-L-alanine amidase [Streptomyces sp. PA03-6a]
MATPLTAAQFLAALKAEGVKVVERTGWKTHNRNSKGAWGPVNGVMMHHTGPYTTESGMVALCWNGRSDLPGPLCHGVIARDGQVHLVGYGRANHAGLGDDDVLDAVIAESKLPVDNEANTDGNARFYGFEVVNRGDGQDWPAAQVEAMVRVGAAICRAHGWHAPSVIGHKEWQPGKPDPTGIDMAEFRARVAERLKHLASWSPQAPTKPPVTKPPALTLEQRIAALEKAVKQLQEAGRGG